MSKSRVKLNYLLHFLVAFLLAWPAIVLLFGSTLGYYYLNLTHRCNHYESALFRTMYKANEIDKSSYIIGRSGFVDPLKTEAKLAQIRELTGNDNIDYIETDILDLLAVVQLVAFLADRNAGAIVLESNPMIWTDYGVQNARKQKYLELLEDDYSVDRFYGVLSAVLDMVDSDCSTSLPSELPDDILSASFLMNYPSIQAEAKNDLQRHARSSRIYWMHDYNYYANTLRGSEDTLKELQQLPDKFEGILGVFVKQ